MTIQNYLINLSKKYSPSGLLDIGAHHGEFSKFCFSLWPKIDILMLEGNEQCENVLDSLPFDHSVVLLSDTNKRVKFYLNPNNLSCTGSSYYKEVTNHYKKSIEVEIDTYTLDEVIQEVGKMYDIVKIDTQGSELDIIKGGVKVIQNASYVILEVPVLQYNEGSPLFDEVIQYMNDIGFKKYEIVEEHLWLDKNDNTFNYGELIQVDAVFTK